MFQHLLVPLDGSRLAEAVLPAARYLAQTFGARVTLLHVVERNAPTAVHHDRHLTRAEEAEAYLREIVRAAFAHLPTINVHVHTAEVSDVAGAIAAHAAELKVDLIVMCAHGHGGPRRWIVGSNAQQVISLQATPVLLIPSDETAGAPAPFSCHRLLVPLDGEPAHEHSLTFAMALARAEPGAVHLLIVIPTPESLSGEEAAAARLMPQAARMVLDLAPAGAEAYLRGPAAMLERAGVIAESEVARGEPAQAIVAAATRTSADVIVLATHARAGLGAFWSGSVAPKVANQSPVPVLLAPVSKS